MVKYFDTQLKRWAKYFGLVNWEIYSRPEKDMDDDAARIDVETVAKMCKVEYCKEWIESRGKKEISKLAFHEMAELYLHKIFTFIEKHSNIDEAQETTHHVINLLENKCFNKLYKEKKGGDKPPVRISQ